MITIPAKDTKKFSQPNYGDTQGNLWGTYNVDLSKNTGRIRVPRTESLFTSIDDTDLKLPVAFTFFPLLDANTPIFVAYAGKVFAGGTDAISTFTQDVATNSPTDTSRLGDMVVFNNKLYVTESSKLKRIAPAAAAWTDITTLTSGGLHQMCVYKDKIYFVDAKLKVYSMNLDESVNVGSYTLDLSYINGHISWIQAGSNRIWIGITKNDGTKGLIFEWDGQSENLWSKNYIIEAQGSAGCAIWNDIPYVMDIEGRLLAFNGANFEEVARLPIMQYDTINFLYAAEVSNKICHFNGIKYINDAIQIAINNQTLGGSSIYQEENYPSGIYQYTKENGLTHKFSPSITKINGLTLDYGQHAVNSIGAIFDATARFTSSNNYFSSVMFGVEIEDQNGDSLFAINIDVIENRTNDPAHKRLGYIITPFIESQRVTDVWKKIIVKYRKMLDSTDKIIVKYRTTKDIPVVLQNIEWSDSVSFTATSVNGISVGDEIEVLNGNGGGTLAHITDITNNGVDYTVTLDTQVAGVATGHISDIRVQSWKKLPEINKDEFQFKELSVPQYNKDTEIQFKVVMNWANKDNELREIIIVNDTEQYAK